MTNNSLEQLHRFILWVWSYFAQSRSMQSSKGTNAGILSNFIQFGSVQSSKGTNAGILNSFIQFGDIAKGMQIVVMYTRFLHRFTVFL